MELLNEDDIESIEKFFSLQEACLKGLEIQIEVT